MAISTPAELTAARKALLNKGAAGKRDCNAMVKYLRLVRELGVSDHENVAEYGSVILSNFRSKLTSDELWQLHEDVAVACFTVGCAAAGSTYVAALERRFPGSTRVAVLRGMAFEAQGQFGQAAELYSSVLVEHPSHGDVLKRQVALRMNEGDTSAAIEAATSYLESFQADATMWDWLARLYTAVGSLEQAAYCLEEALLYAPADVVVVLRLADTLYSLGGVSRLAAARGYYCKAIDVSKGESLRALYGVLGTISAQKGTPGAIAGASGEDVETAGLVAARLLQQYRAHAPDKMPLVQSVLNAHGIQASA